MNSVQYIDKMLNESSESKFDYDYDLYYNPENVPTPSEYFKLKPYGVVTFSDIQDNTKKLKWEVIDETDKVFTINTWYKFNKKIPQLISKSMVDDFKHY